ncbi:hypothetical protein DFH07DRAFT_470175 [Mycena maculata]|uniref:GDP-fucose protein O-fucosyltransferase 2 n=1 Tax=Mycena maculata TaxID=230809 RepID=A0AAD7K8I0_9AGAR|nr:hypothetical protein DFH07DRAFT_470175 [Mycena maculata]
MRDSTSVLKTLSSRRWLAALVVSSVLFVLGITSTSLWDSELTHCVSHSLAGSMPHAAVYSSTQNVDAAKQKPSSKFDTATLLLKGTASPSFRENLRPDVKYITSWPYEGFTNQMIAYMNLVYLGLITERVPIIPRFTSSRHTTSDTPDLDFGEVFDIPRLQEAINLPILQWSQVKDPDSQFVDDLGCWNTQNSIFYSSDRNFHPPGSLKLDVSYTTAPEWIRYPTELQHPTFPHALLWALASLAFNDSRTWTPREPDISPTHHVALPPDDHLLCYDLLYYAGAHEIFEYNYDMSPVWRFVGQHMHWTPKIQKIAESYTRETLGIAGHAPISPYISVHARRTDFEIWCNGVTTKDCYVELSAIARRVEDVKAELLARKGIQVDQVIITSDEKDPEWWDAVGELGWRQPNHSKTVELYGPWYPPLIDKAIQSGSLGFVGTDRSTFSSLSLRRVRSWNDGAARMVLWGTRGADDH